MVLLKEHIKRKKKDRIETPCANAILKDLSKEKKTKGGRMAGKYKMRATI